MKTRETYRPSARILKALAHPARLTILNALRDEEECVCHLTALLGQRQAYVSQHLMFLRRAGLIVDRKEGLRVYYHVRDPRLFDVLDMVGLMAGKNESMGGGAARRRALARCACPHCAGADG
jgi:ArsR family transcriptional regulator